MSHPPESRPVADDPIDPWDDSQANHPAPNEGGYRLSTLGRWLVVSWSLFLVGGFSLAASLTPDPLGYGTHQQLGLPACSFQVMFDIPCPSCGMTTSFSHFVRGEWISSAIANPGGLLLALACAVQVPWCWYSVYRSRLVGMRQPDAWLIWTIATLCLVTGINWLLRVIL